MIGVKSADADYYYFLNNDCILLNDCISILYDFMVSHPEAANASGEMFIADGTYEYNFRYFPSNPPAIPTSSFPLTSYSISTTNCR
jgi:GT2 family glycosyltransferase